MRFGPYTVDISNRDKVLFPGDGITKGDLVDYYREVGEVLLPHLQDRPLVLRRYPDGIQEDGFFQKQVGGYFPDWIPTVRVAKTGGTQDLAVCNNLATLIYLANQAAIELHRWGTRRDRVRRPDRLVLDLDPPGNAFGPVRDAAFRCRDLLEEIGLPAFPMLTGSRGVHVVVPLDRSAGQDAVLRLARELARELADRDPDRLTVALRREKRGRRLFVDAGRNAYAQTAVAPYSVRARPGAPVAVPLRWEELEARSLSADAFDRGAVLERLAGGDPWKGMGRRAVSAGAARSRLRNLRRRT